LRFFNLLKDVSLVKFIPALFQLRDKLFPFPFWTLVAIEIPSLGSSAKSILNALPLAVVGMALKRFWNASYSSIATLRYSNKRAFLVLFACFVYRTK